MDCVDIKPVIKKGFRLKRELLSVQLKADEGPALFQPGVFLSSSRGGEEHIGVGTAISKLFA